MQDDSSKLSEEMKPSLYLQTHPYNSSTCCHVCSSLEKLILVIKIRCLLLSYQPPAPLFSTQLVSYSYVIFRKNKTLHQNQFNLPDSSMSASSSHSWKARLSSFLFFTHSSSGSVSVSAGGPLYQSPTHHQPQKEEGKKVSKNFSLQQKSPLTAFQYTVT